MMTPLALSDVQHDLEVLSLRWPLRLEADHAAQWEDRPICP